MCIILLILDFWILSSCKLWPSRSVLPRLADCATDDDVAMHLLKQAGEFEKYIHYMAGQTQAEASVTEKAVQQYLNTRVTPPSQIQSHFIYHCFVFNLVFESLYLYTRIQQSQGTLKPLPWTSSLSFRDLQNAFRPTRPY